MASSRFPLGVTAVMLPELDFAQQIALCTRLGLTHYSIRPRIIPADQKDAPPGNWGRHAFDLTPQRLLAEGKAIAQQLTAAGMTPFGTVPATSVSASDEELVMHFEGAALAGAGRVRVSPLPCPKQVFDYPKLLAETVAGYKRAVQLARPFGQKIVIETHARTIATSPCLALNICREFDPAELGVIFDISNFNIEGALQPVVAVSVLAPYIDHIHIGGSHRVSTGTDAQGFDIPAIKMTALTQAHLYLPEWIKTLDEAGLHVPIIIEDYTPNMPGALRLERSAGDLKRLVESINS